MTIARSFAPLVLLTLAACGPRETPEAPPGAVERTTKALERKAAADRNATVRRIDREAEARSRDSKERIKAIESERGTAD